MLLRVVPPPVDVKNEFDGTWSQRAIDAVDDPAALLPDVQDSGLVDPAAIGRLASALGVENRVLKLDEVPALGRGFAAQKPGGNCFESWVSEVCGFHEGKFSIGAGGGDRGRNCDGRLTATGGGYGLGVPQGKL